MTAAYNDADQLVGQTYSGGPLSGLAVTNLYDGSLRRSTPGVSGAGPKTSEIKTEREPRVRCTPFVRRSFLFHVCVFSLRAPRRPRLSK